MQFIIYTTKSRIIQSFFFCKTIRLSVVSTAACASLELVSVWFLCNIISIVVFFSRLYAGCQLADRWWWLYTFLFKDTSEGRGGWGKRTAVASGTGLYMLVKATSSLTMREKNEKQTPFQRARNFPKMHQRAFSPLLSVRIVWSIVCTHVLNLLYKMLGLLRKVIRMLKCCLPQSAALLAFSVSYHRPGALCPLTALVSAGGGLLTSVSLNLFTTAQQCYLQLTVQAIRSRNTVWNICIVIIIRISLFRLFTNPTILHT